MSVWYFGRADNGGQIKRYEPRTWECKLKGGANDKFTPWERVWSVLFNAHADHPA